MFVARAAPRSGRADAHPQLQTMLLERRSPPDPSSIVGASPVVRTLSAEAATAVAATMQPVALPAGDSPFPEDDRIDALDEAHLTMHTPVEAFSMMDFPRPAELVALGREYACGAIREWRVRELSMPTGDVTRERRAATPHPSAIASV